LLYEKVVTIAQKNKNKSVYFIRNYGNFRKTLDNLRECRYTKDGDTERNRIGKRGNAHGFTGRNSICFGDLSRHDALVIQPQPDRR